MHKNIIADTSCLVLLEKIDKLDILRKLYGNITITPVIANEFGSELPNWMEVRKTEDQKYQRLLETNIDPGEASGIALAVEIGGLLILDDKKARTLAQELKLDVTGTLGVLVGATRNNHISSFDQVLKRIKQTNFHLSEDLEQKLLTLVNES
jgi:predicted nucleic acid-binding protein